MKGIVLAGGSGSRLHPLTHVVSKQLLPVYDKPMIYYPISVLMLAGIREILLITTPSDAPLFQRLLGDGSRFGVSFSYETQSEPRGLAEAYVIGRDFVGGQPSALVLGDNVFHGSGMAGMLKTARNSLRGAALFGARVSDPGRYGVAEVDSSGKVLGIEEKPSIPKSNVAVTGLYLYDGSVVDVVRELKPSPRGELEITDVNNAYVARGTADLTLLPRGTAWLDTGTPESLLQASQFVEALQNRQGTYIACLEEVALRMGYMGLHQLERSIELHGKSPYGEYLRSMLSGGLI
jgi:glucose-1-phosphate thymidylyltransferase